MEKRVNSYRIVWIIWLASTVFYVWMAAQIPYCHDDWDWGLPIGIQQFVTASLNSRYAGNLIEVVLTRSLFMKDLTMGLVFSILPISTAILVSRILYGPGWREHLLIPVIMGNILMLTIPLSIWQQTFSWVAGFSNFVVSTLLLVFWQMILISSQNEKKASWIQSAVLFVFGVAMQLFLENVSVYVMIVTTVTCIFRLLHKQRKNPCYSLWLGNLLGTVIMFSSSMYTTLIVNGTAVDGYRKLSFNKSENPFVVLLRFFRRFVIVYPHHLWIRNTVLCCTVLLLLILVLLIKCKGLNIRFQWCAVDVLFICYTIRVWLLGEIRLSSQWWTNVLTAALAILFFLVVLFQILQAFKDRKTLRNALLFCWISAPMIIAPMVVIDGIGPRSFLSSDLFIAEFSLLLMLFWLKESPQAEIRIVTTVLTLMLCALWIRFGTAYVKIGETDRKRLQEIRSAQNGEKDHLILQGFPYGEYLWQTDPEYDDKERIRFFRDFYKIPDGVDLWFQYWGNREDREIMKSEAKGDT